MIPNIVKGLSTFLPPVNNYRKRLAATGGTDSPRYCYSVWLRHYVHLRRLGLEPEMDVVGEIGPGDSIGVGLSALLSGASAYYGLDLVPFATRADALGLLGSLVALFRERRPIPGPEEFPLVRPLLPSYEFPQSLAGRIDRALAEDRLAEIRRDLASGVRGPRVTYVAPWISEAVIQPSSLTMLVSTAALEHVDDLPRAYEAMCRWLVPGGIASHVIDFTAHWLSPHWDGHLAYTPLQWRLVRGKREFLLNRMPLSAHIQIAKAAGFDVLAIERDTGRPSVGDIARSGPSATWSQDDRLTCSATIVLRKRKA